MTISWRTDLLQILYRAATRTFHSTTVLRHLFTVHAALTDLQIASKALDSYLEIVTKGKLRADKSSQPEPGLDTDEQMLTTVAAGISMLCEYGDYEEAIRALKLADFLENWLSEHEHISSVVIDGHRRIPQTEANESVSGVALALVHRAVGVSRANWADRTFEASDRAQLRSSAVKHLRQAVRADVPSGEDPYILYPLALVLAETRDIEAAIVVVKQALLSESKVFTEPVDRDSLRHDLKSKKSHPQPLVECWHLLALLLSARQEFETAQAAAQAAIEFYETSTGSHSQLSFPRKRQIVEAKMTQIALTDIVDGPEEAVNSGGELLQIFTKLFDVSDAQRPLTRGSGKRPQTIESTTKSFRRSLFGRKSLRHSFREGHIPETVKEQRQSADTSKPPTIAITNGEDGKETEIKDFQPQPPPSRHSSHKLQKRASQKSVRRSRGVSPAPRRHETSSIGTRPTTSATTRTEPTNGDHPQLPPIPAPSDGSREVGVAVTHDLRASVTAQLDALSMNNLPSAPPKDPPTILNHSVHPGPHTAPPHARLHALAPPAPHFPAAAQSRLTLNLLNRVWLFVAALYRRAGLLPDARGALDEAFALAHRVEAAVAARPPGASARAFDAPAPAGLRGVEAVWADAYAELAAWSLARGEPHEALRQFEGALGHLPDHAAATVGLAGILLDVYEGKLSSRPTEPSQQDESSDETPETAPPTLAPLPAMAEPTSEPQRHLRHTSSDTEPFPTFEPDESAVIDGDSPVNGAPASASGAAPAWGTAPGPKEDALPPLGRLAARDRAHALLTALTRRGHGWDDSEAWFALARALEAGGQLERAREVLWWVVELEEQRPVRNWGVLGPGCGLGC